MPFKKLASGRVRVNLGLGPNSQILGTIGTVPAGKSWVFKELIAFVLFGSSPAGTSNFTCYILPSGATDITANVSTDNSVMIRARNENASIVLYDTDVPGVNANTTSYSVVLYSTRRLIVSAGDAIKAWVHYGAVTPGNTDLSYILSGIEFP